jgi:flagellar motor protein MotB
VNEPNNNRKLPNSPTTRAVLKFVRGDQEGKEHAPHSGGGGHGGDDHDEQIHVDERWLIAYADKMTLLAGLFIMLFSMSTLDKIKFEKVKQSTEKSFGKPVDKQTTEFVDLATLNKSIEQLEQSKRELEKSKVSETALKAKLREVEKQIEQRKQDKVVIEEAQKQIAQLNKTIEHQRLEIQDLKENQQELEKRIPKTDPENKITELQKIIKQQDRRIETLETELAQAKATAASGSFLAFVMSWSTKSHDIDLKVEDPEGRTFDFKHRQHKDHPGLFVLDTRQGPGAEIWQADKVLVGVYTFTFHFYNKHGNPEPCQITAKLFTPKGGVEIPELSMDGTAKRSHTVKIQLDANGKAKLLP